MDTALINIGNTHTEISSMDLGNYVKLPTSDLLLEIGQYLKKFDSCVIASVVPSSFKAIEAYFKPDKIKILSPKSIDTINFSEVDVSTLGADRLANMMAAQELYGESVVVLDCGTCITAELIVNGVFLGGLIMPGRMLQRKAMNEFTGQLPNIPLNKCLLEVGENTADSIRVGVDYLSVIGLQRWVSEQTKAHSKLKVCFTGGDSLIFSQTAQFDYKECPHLTLEGLRLFAAKVFKAK